jgi:hypothetical protein
MILLKPQDVVVMLKLGLAKSGVPLPFAQLGLDLGISASEIHAAVTRSASAALLDAGSRRPRVSPLLEFLEHGVKYVFVSKRGELTRGFPTAHSAPPLSDLIVQGGTKNDSFVHSAPLVWPHPEGEVRGESLEPLYPSAVDAARRDGQLYECLALVDALRVGRARERALAIDLLRTRLLGTSGD